MKMNTIHVRDGAHRTCSHRLHSTCDVFQSEKSQQLLVQSRLFFFYFSRISACSLAHFACPCMATRLFLLFLLFWRTCTACPDNYEYCDDEGGTCYFTGNVAYGMGSTYVFMDATDSISCTNSVFGDPTPGVFKECCSKLSILLMMYRSTTPTMYCLYFV